MSHIFEIGKCVMGMQYHFIGACLLCRSAQRAIGLLKFGSVQFSDHFP